MTVTIGNNIEIAKRLFAFVGNYGSGKTEVAVNFTLALAQVTKPVAIVDMDVVNPYFRCREAQVELEKQGIETIFPKGEYFWADLPIILPEVKGVLERANGHVVLDVGGEDMGVRVLASFDETLKGKDADYYFVLNLSRPFTDNVKGCLDTFKMIEDAGKMKLTGIVLNTHLINDTTPDIIYSGYEKAREVSDQSRLPIKFVAVEQGVLDQLDISKINSPILPLVRIMRPPWEAQPVCRFGPKDLTKAADLNQNNRKR